MLSKDYSSEILLFGILLIQAAQHLHKRAKSRKMLLLVRQATNAEQQR
jgi:hypothetical protein